jgi:hypothetical protein
MRDLAKKSTTQSSIILERNIPVPMRDGVCLFANLFRPRGNGPWAVVMSVTPYGKDKLPDRLGQFFMRLSGVKFGKLNRSRFAGLESPASPDIDPAEFRDRRADQLFRLSRLADVRMHRFSLAALGRADYLCR